MNKREFLKSSALIGAGLATGIVRGTSSTAANSFVFSQSTLNPAGEYALPPLPYAYNALEPHIDEATMKLHHDIHHAGYVKGLNTAVKKVSEAMDSGDFSLIKHWEREMAFHGAGHFLHVLFWNNMGPASGKRSETFEKYIIKSFGSFDRFFSLFKQATASVEGSGWGILAYQPDGDRLVVLQAEKHQNQSQWTTIPILVCDVWEHAYYLKYQNKRTDYINGFMQVVNWDSVSAQLEGLLK
ncbi:MAG TPA: superoxide dismutase [Bacteroidales bacterium]|nr:superoxide dismutase [Bacteroidales bacterium]